MKKAIIFSILSIFGVYCNATEISQDESGNTFKLGYRDEPITEGLYYINYKASRLLFSAKPSWKGLNRRAVTLCKNTSYNLIRKKEYLTGRTGEGPGQTFVVDAYAICNPEKMTIEEANKFIDEHLNPPIIINENLVQECDIPAPFTINKESILAEIETLLTEKRYSDSIKCLEKIISTEDNPTANKQAYFQLGLIYELGQGVDKNKDKAMNYYKKSE